MFGIDWSEYGIIAVIALLVIGPKDLPKVMRALGQWSRRIKAMANEFQRNVDDMVRQAELDDLKKQAEAAIDISATKRDIENAIGAEEIEQAFKADDVPAPNRGEPRIAPEAPETSESPVFRQPSPTADPIAMAAQARIEDIAPAPAPSFPPEPATAVEAPAVPAEPTIHKP